MPANTSPAAKEQAPFEPGVVYSPRFCREALNFADMHPDWFLELTQGFAKKVSVDQVRRSMEVWGIWYG